MILRCLDSVYLKNLAKSLKEISVKEKTLTYVSLALVPILGS